QMKAELGRIADVMAYAADPRGGAVDAVPEGMPARLQGTIELKSVRFGYNPNEPALIEGFDLAVRPGMRGALVGASGSGKSTIARLICGLYTPWSGEVRIDGIRLAEIPPLVLANSLAYVDQDPVLFSGSLRDNIAMWNAGIDDAALARALRDAAILDEV